MRVQQTYTVTLDVIRYLQQRKLDDPDFNKSAYVTQLIKTDIKAHYKAHPGDKNL